MQLLQEKMDLQRSLLYFERLKGRPQDSQSKRTMKPLYDRYRAVRRLVRSTAVANSSTPVPPSQPPLKVGNFEDHLAVTIPEPAVSESSCLLAADEQCYEQTASPISCAIKTSKVIENHNDLLLDPEISLTE